MKKIVSILLTFSLIISSTAFIMPQTAFAANENENVEYQKELVSTDIDYFIDEETGNKYKLITEEYLETPISENEYTEGNATTRSLFPEYNIGSRKSWTFRVSNDELGGIGDLGSTLSDRGKELLKQKMTQKVIASIGSSLLTGVNVASWIAIGLSTWNGYIGNNGFQAIVLGVYSSTYINGGGYYMYGWAIDEVRFSTY